MSGTTIPDRDSSRADLIGPRVALLATHPAALHRRRLGGAKEKSMREKALGRPHQAARDAAGSRPRLQRLSAASQPLPSILSTLALNDVLQGIQGPGNPIAYMRLRLFQGLDAGLGTFELQP